MNRLAIFARSAFAFTAAAALAVSATPAQARSADGQDRRVAIENQSGQAIVYVYGSPASQSDFGEDRIPDRVIANGEASVVDFDSGTRECRYDLRVTLADGSNVDRMGVNVCQAAHWTVGRRTNAVR